MTFCFATSIALSEPGVAIGVIVWTWHSSSMPGAWSYPEACDEWH